MVCKRKSKHSNISSFNIESDFRCINRVHLIHSPTTILKKKKFNNIYMLKRYTQCKVFLIEIKVYGTAHNTLCK